MLAAIMAVSAVLALIWYATTPRRYEYNVLYGPAHFLTQASPLTADDRKDSKIRAADALVQNFKSHLHTENRPAGIFPKTIIAASATAATGTF